MSKRKPHQRADFDIFGYPRKIKMVRGAPQPVLHSYRHGRKVFKALRDLSLVVNDRDLRLEPTGKRPKRNEKRRPSRPGRRI